MIRVRAGIDGVPVYGAGRRGSVDDPVNQGFAQLASNESPFPPLPSVSDAIARAAAGVNRYPDIDGMVLRARLADAHGVGEDQIVLGCGSIEVCHQAVTISAGPGTEVVYAWPTFPEYTAITALAGARARRVPLAGARHDVVAMAKAVTEETRVVFVCNPNNPTGTALTGAELAYLLDAIPSWCLVVVDEAYAEFADAPEFGSALELLRAHENVLVLRTFSKAYGLAGLRVGYGVTSVEVASLLRLAKIPFSVGNVALAAAVASIDAGSELVARMATIKAERDRVANQLAGLGWDIPSSQANFLWIPASEARADAVARRCAESKVLIRQYPDGLRITIGTEEENGRLLDALGSPDDLPPTNVTATATSLAGRAESSPHDQ